MFSLEQIRGFVTAADEGHIGRAADALCMTQPPLSRQIQKLEQDIGAALFERHRRGVDLTAAGRVFLPEARRLLALAESAPRAARRTAAGRSGSISIGFTAASGFQVLGDLVGALERDLPDVEPLLREMVSNVQVEGLHRGELDVGLVRPPVTDPELASALVHTEPLVVAAPDGDRGLPGSGPVPVSDLQGARLLAYAPDQARYFADLVERVLAGVRVRPVHHLTQVHTMISLVAAGRGLALVPASAERMHRAGVRFRPLVGPVDEAVQLHAVWRRDTANPAVAPVLALFDRLRPQG